MTVYCSFWIAKYLLQMFLLYSQAYLATLVYGIKSVWDGSLEELELDMDKYE